MIETGIKGYQEIEVTKADTATAYTRGTLDVLATPRMIALVEEAAWKSLTGYLDPGMGTVGIKLEVKHLAPTPVGMRVWCETVLSEVDGKRLVFDAAVFDEAGKIGEGAHERFLVEEERFQRKADQKREPGAADGTPGK